MGPIVDPKDVNNGGPRSARGTNAEACSRECHESSALCTWPACTCPATVDRSSQGTLYPSAVPQAA
jgi:hypothetical protein